MTNDMISKKFFITDITRLIKYLTILIFYFTLNILVYSFHLISLLKLHEKIQNKALLLPSGLHPWGKFKENV